MGKGKFWDEQWQGSSCTPVVVTAADVFRSIFIDPRDNVNEISDERWNWTFDDSGIAAHDVLFDYLGVVELIDDWD
jgi:hypothetical protein